MLSDRRQKVLAALIEEYVARALPVGSRTLTERYQLGVSSATVRNELSVLEDGGYITQPHTSAGRIPTDFGYRTFVDGLLSANVIEEDVQLARAAERLRRSASELDDLLERTSSELARFTECLSIVLAPSVLNLRIRQISLISLTPRRALTVLVTEDAQVFNHQMEFSEDVTPGDLSAVQSLLGEALTGKSTREIEEGLAQSIAEAYGNPLVSTVLSEVLSCMQEGELSRAHRLGMSSLLTQPEFSTSQAVLPVLRAIENDAMLLEILDDAGSADTGVPSVHIGSENKSEALSGVSVIASQYGRGDSVGVVAVIGPTRMDYSKVIRAVRTACAALGD